MKTVRTKRWPELLMTTAVVMTIAFLSNAHAQVIVSSRPMIHHEVDAVECITDYGDSVYVITRAGNVVAYNRDFTGERLVSEAMQVHATSAFVFDGALFFQSSSGQFVINDRGTIQYLDVSPAVVGRDATMMPFAVTDFGVFEIRRSSDGTFAPVLLGHRIQRQSTIYSMARINDCIFVSYQAGSKPEPPCTLHRSDGSVEEYALNPGEWGIRFFEGPQSTLVVAEFHEYYWVLSPCAADTVRRFHITDDNNTIRVNGVFARTGASAPWAHAVWQAAWSASRLYQHDGTSFKKQLWYGGADSLYLHYNSATSDSAIYAWGNDGWVVRYSLSSGQVSVRKTIVPRRYGVFPSQLSGQYRGLTGRAGTNSRDSAEHIFITNGHIVARVPIDAFDSSNARPRPGTVRFYLRYPAGSEIIVATNDIMIKSSDGRWRTRKIPNTVNESGIGVFILDDSTFVYRGIAFSERSRNIVELAFHSQSQVFSSNLEFVQPYFDGHLVVNRDRIVYARIRHTEDSVVVDPIREFVTRSTPSETVPPTTRGDTLVTLLSMEYVDSLNVSSDLKAIIVRRLNRNFDVVDSIRIVPKHLERAHMLLPIRDTLYRIQPLTNAFKRMTSTSESDWAPIPALPGTPKLVHNYYLPSTARYVGNTIEVDLHTPDRVRTMVFGIDSTTLFASDQQEAHNVTFQHLFMLNVFPNPAIDRMTLEMRRHQTSEASSTELFLADLLGNRVRDYSAVTSFTFPVGTVGRTSLDVSGLPAAAYLLVLRNGGFTSSKLVAVSH